MAEIIQHPDAERRLDEYIFTGQSGTVKIYSLESQPLTYALANWLLDCAKQEILKGSS